MRRHCLGYHFPDTSQGAQDAWLQVASLGDSGFRLMRGGQCAFASEVRWMQENVCREKCFDHSLSAKPFSGTNTMCL